MKFLMKFNKVWFIVIQRTLLTRAGRENWNNNFNANPIHTRTVDSYSNEKVNKRDSWKRSMSNINFSLITSDKGLTSSITRERVDCQLM